MRKYFITVIVLFSAATLYLVIRKNYLEFNSTVSIKNTRWEKVHIQVRKGYSPDPLRNKLIFDKDLALGESHTFKVDNGDDIIYRRDKDPDHADGKHYTNWIYANCYNASYRMVDDP
jgi:hypothetical protein